MKVGKAIYNILSQSTDVQSNFPFNTTDYAPTGTELVTNGDFSAAGTELIVDGGFPNGSTAWSEIDGGTIVDNQMVLDCGTTTNAYTYQSKATAYTFGKSYQVTVTISSNTTGVSLILYPFSNSPYTSAITVGATAETHTISFVPDYTSGSGKTFVLRALSSTGIVVIDDVSVKELGEGWTVQGGVGGDTVTFGDSFAEIIKANVDTLYFQQDYPVTLGASHKLTYTVLENTFTGSLTELALSGASAYGSTVLDSSPSLTPKTIYLSVTDDTVSNALKFYSQGDGGSIKITNITVQEMILTKIFPELAPPDIDAPYIVYSVVSNSPSETKNANGDIDTANIEVYGFQDTYNKAVDLGVSVRAALDRKTGTYNTIQIQSTNYVNEQMDVNEARKLWAAIQDYSIRIKNI